MEARQWGSKAESAQTRYPTPTPKGQVGTGAGRGTSPGGSKLGSMRWGVGGVLGTVLTSLVFLTAHMAACPSCRRNRGQHPAQPGPGRTRSQQR